MSVPLPSAWYTAETISEEVTSLSSLTDDQSSAWQRAGWLHLSGVLGRSTMISLDRWVDDLEYAAEGRAGTDPYCETDDAERLVSIAAFTRTHRQLSSFTGSGVIVDVLAELFGEPALLLLDRIEYRHPGHPGRPPHQDAAIYPTPVDRHITCMIPLDQSTPGSGCLSFASNPAGGLVDATDGRIDPEWADAAEWTTVPCRPGDLLFFDALTPHRSVPNTTGQRRRALFLTYNPASAGDQRSTIPVGSEVFAAITTDLVG